MRDWAGQQEGQSNGQGRWVGNSWNLRPFVYVTLGVPSVLPSPMAGNTVPKAKLPPMPSTPRPPGRLRIPSIAPVDRPLIVNGGVLNVIPREGHDGQHNVDPGGQLLKSWVGVGLVELGWLEGGQLRRRRVQDGGVTAGGQEEIIA